LDECDCCLRCVVPFIVSAELSSSGVCIRTIPGRILLFIIFNSSRFVHLLFILCIISAHEEKSSKKCGWSRKTQSNKNGVLRDIGVVLHIYVYIYIYYFVGKSSVGSIEYFVM
jgi:hypothetical protein